MKPGPMMALTWSHLVVGEARGTSPTRMVRSCLSAWVSLELGKLSLFHGSGHGRAKLFPLYGFHQVVDDAAP